MGKGETAIKYVNSIFRRVLDMRKEVYVNMFDSKGFNYLNHLESDLKATSLNARNWYQINKEI